MSDFGFLPDDPDKLQSSMGAVAPGKGMALIKGFSMYTGGKGSYAGTQHELELEIVAWSDQGSLGATHTEGIWHADKEADGSDKKKNYAAQIATLVCAAGLLKLADLKLMSMQQIDVAEFYAKLIDRPVMIEIASRPKKDDPTKVYNNIAQYGRAIFHMKDPRVKDWPRNTTIFNANAHKVGEWVTDAKPAAKTAAPAAKTEKPAAPAAPTADPFGALG